MKRHIFTVLLFLFASLFSALAQEDSDENTYYLTDSDGWGGVPKGWERQQKILKDATDSDLETMALHSDTPAIRAMAFDALARKWSLRCYDVLLASLSDSASFMVASYDVWFSMNVASFNMEVANSDPGLFSAKQRYLIDSMVVFSPGLQHLNKFFSASRLRGMKGLSERLHTLYLEGDANLLPLIAEDKNDNDIPLIISALLEYKVGLDKEGANSKGPKGNTNQALNALVNWQNEAFLPILEEVRDYELKRKYIDYYRVKMLFKVVMAYDNEWAYNFIEETFEKKKAKDKYSYPENLYRAYYEENGPSRFQPLIDKYGKQPYIF